MTRLATALWPRNWWRCRYNFQLQNWTVLEVNHIGWECTKCVNMMHKWVYYNTFGVHFIHIMYGEHVPWLMYPIHYWLLFHCRWSLTANNIRDIRELTFQEPTHQDLDSALPTKTDKPASNGPSVLFKTNSSFIRKRNKTNRTGTTRESLDLVTVLALKGSSWQSVYPNEDASREISKIKSSC